MRTTVDIDEKLLADVVEQTGEKSKGKALNKALEEYLYWRAVEGLRAMAGKVEFMDDVEQMLEEQKAREIVRLKRARV